MIQRNAHVRDTMPIAKKHASVPGTKTKMNSYELNNIGRCPLN